MKYESTEDRAKASHKEVLRLVPHARKDTTWYFTVAYDITKTVMRLGFDEKFCFLIFWCCLDEVYGKTIKLLNISATRFQMCKGQQLILKEKWDLFGLVEKRCKICKRYTQRSIELVKQKHQREMKFSLLLASIPNAKLWSKKWNIIVQCACSVESTMQ